MKMPINGDEDVSTGTQTEEEEALVLGLEHLNGHASGSSAQVNGEHLGGFFSSLLTRVIPSLKRTEAEEHEVEDESNNAPDLDRRSISTQTEEPDPLISRGQQLSFLLIQELVLDRSIPGTVRDDVYESLCSCVAEILDKHSNFFRGLVQRVEIINDQMFLCVANELFEANANNDGELRITWGRVVSLFAFAVRLAQDFRNDLDRVDEIMGYLISYVTKNVIPFVRSNGGWAGLVEQFPVPGETEGQTRRAIIWSGLCVGLVATMFVSSKLR